MQVAVTWSMVEEVENIKQVAASLPVQWLDNIQARDVNSLLGRILLRDLFTLYFPHRVLPGIAFTKLGRPYFIHSSVHFSISHSERYVACALAGKRVGIDIEEIKLYDEKLLAKLYTKRQQEFVFHSGNPSRAFFKIWTEREAVFKATNQAGDSILSRIEGIDSYLYGGGHWNTSQLDLSEQLVCSLATSELDGEPVIHLNGPRVYKDILASNGSRFLR